MFAFVGPASPSPCRPAVRRCSVVFALSVRTRTIRRQRRLSRTNGGCSHVLGHARRSRAHKLLPLAARPSPKSSYGCSRPRLDTAMRAMLDITGLVWSPLPRITRRCMLSLACSESGFVSGRRMQKQRCSVNGVLEQRKRKLFHLLRLGWNVTPKQFRGSAIETGIPYIWFENSLPLQGLINRRQ